MLLKEAFNFYTLLFGNNTIKQKTVHLSIACYAHVFPYNAAKHIFTR
jgi:hypothetical protein